MTRSSLYAFRLAALLLLPAAACDQDVDAGEPAAPGRTVKVSTAGAEATVVLSTLPAADHDGVLSVTLLSVVTAAELGASPGVADLVAADGFRSSTSPNCTSVLPLANARLDDGLVSVSSGDVTWTADPPMPGCLSARGLVEVVLDAP